MQGSRRHVRAKVGCLGVTAPCMALLLPAPSQAATGDLVYKASKLRPLPAGKQATATARCPNDTVVVGGGMEIEGGNTATGMQSSYPFDGADEDAIPDDGWRGVANSRSAGDKALTTFAICSKAGRYRYVTRLQDPVADESQGQVDVPCPPGWQVVGGGVKLSFGGANTTSYVAAGTVPYDITGDGIIDYWRAVSSNQSGINQDLTGYAICAKTGAYRYKEVTANAPGGSQTTAEARCPKRTALMAGGVQAGTVDLRAEVAASRPIDGGDRDMLPDDKWWGAINDNGPAPVELRVYSICRKGT